MISLSEKTQDRRPPLSPRENAAFSRLLIEDRAAAMALCFFTLADADSTEKVAARSRALAALERARAADAAANEGRGNFFSRQYAAWEAQAQRVAA